MSDQSSDSYMDVDILGQLLNNKYIPIKKINSGRDAAIWLVYKYSKKNNIKKDEQNYYILKQFDNTDDGIESAKEEMSCIKKLNDAKVKNVINSLDSFVHDDEYNCIIYPLLKCSLHSLLKDNIFSFNTVRKITWKLLMTLKKMHNSLGMLHMDIKPDNILMYEPSEYVTKIKTHMNPNFATLIHKYGLQDGIQKFLKQFEKLFPEKSNIHVEKKNIIELIDPQICLTDFAYSCRVKDRAENHSRTEYYVSPEDILEYEHLDNSLELWSIGCMIFELLTGNILFDPRRNKDNSESADHLYKIQTLIGVPSEEYLSKCKYRINFYKCDRRLKGWNYYEYKSLRKLLYESLKPYLEEYSKKYNLLMEFTLVEDFLLKIFKWDTRQRASIDELLQHPWIKHLSAN